MTGRGLRTGEGPARSAGELTDAETAGGGLGASWTQQAELTAADGTGDDSFGISAALSGTTAVLGAYGHGSGAGTAYVFANV